MSPQLQETRLPAGYTLATMPAAQPRHDERPMLRDRDGHVLAVVERWLPDADAVN